MSKKKNKEQETEEQAVEQEVEQTPEEAAQQAEEQPVPETNPWEEKYNAEHDSYLRLAADYDNYRKRTLKEKEQSYTNGKSDAVAKLLPVYDNLERALQQETQDAAFKKGVEMTMNELVKIFTGLGVEIYGKPGDLFDPNLHNAVMHTEEEDVTESTVTQVFQKGFKIGDKIVRYAMVQVAN